MSRPSHRCCSCLYRLIGYTGVMVTCFLGETQPDPTVEQAPREPDRPLAFVAADFLDNRSETFAG